MSTSATIIEALGTWKPNRVSMAGGMVGMLFFGSTGFMGFVPLATMVYPGFGASFLMFCMGMWYAREAAKFDAMERREGNRNPVPVSELSLEVARQVTGSMELTDMGDIDPHPSDMKKTKAMMLATITRLRIREACGDGSLVYYDHGRVHSRKPRTEDLTVLPEP